MNPLERLKEIASALGLAGGDSAEVWFDASNPVCRDAERLLRAGRAAEAEELFNRVLIEPRHAAAAKRQMPRILLALATAQIRQQKWDAADNSAARAWAILSELRYRTTPEYAECCRLRAEAAKGRGAMEDALRFFREALAAVESQKHPRPAEIIRCRIEIAAMQREMGRWEEAEAVAAEGARLAGEKLKGSREEGDALLEWAQCLAGCGRFAEARAAGEQAADIHRAACGDSSGEVAADYEKLGSICQKQQDYPAAVAYLEKALGVRERQIGGDTSELALLLVALADLYSLLGRLAPALELLQQAVGKLGPSKDSNLAGALEKLGSMYVRTGRYEDAADCYQRAFDFWSGDPDAYADRISANRQALENLIPWLPDPAEKKKPETADSGVQVLREPGAVRGADGAPGAAHAGFAQDSGRSPASGAARVAGPGSVASGLRAGGARLPQAGQGAVGSQLAGRQGALPPAGLPAAAGADAGAGTGVAPATGSSSRIEGHGPGGAQSAEDSGNPPGASGAGRMRAALLALSESLSLERDAHGFCGWEDLHFDQIPR